MAIQAVLWDGIALATSLQWLMLTNMATSSLSNADVVLLATGCQMKHPQLPSAVKDGKQQP